MSFKSFTQIFCMNLFFFHIIFTICFFSNTPPSHGVNVITLDRLNTITIEETVTYAKIDDVLDKISTHNYAKKTMMPRTLNMLIYSNGGDVEAGHELILEMANHNSNKLFFNCYALIAKSIAFDIFQHCNRRYVIRNSQLLQHEAYISLNDNVTKITDAAQKWLDYLNKINENLDKYVAFKLNMPYTSYMKLLNATWRINGADQIIKNKLADEKAIIINLHEFFSIKSLAPFY